MQMGTERHGQAGERASRRRSRADEVEWPPRTGRRIKQAGVHARPQIKKSRSYLYGWRFSYKGTQIPLGSSPTHMVSFASCTACISAKVPVRTSIYKNTCVPQNTSARLPVGSLAWLGASLATHLRGGNGGGVGMLCEELPVITQI